jgi:hypothetical protein
MPRPPSPEDAIRACVAHLAGALDERIQTLATELLEGARAERDIAVAEARVAAEVEMNRVRSLEAERAAEAERERQQEIQHIKAEIQQEHARTVAKVQQEFEDTLAAQIAEALADATKAHVTELARVRAQAAQAAALEGSKARSAAERDFAAEIDRVKSEAEASIAARVAAALAEAQERTQEKGSRRKSRNDATADATEDRRRPLFLGLALVRGIRALEHASTATDVLDTLARTIAEEAGRLAILILRGAEAEIWNLSGFGSAIDCGRRELDSKEIDTGGPSAIAQAIDRGEPCYSRKSASGTPDRTGLRFAELPAGNVGLAVPLQVSGQTVAVVYADDVTDGGRTITTAWPELVEILVRHAARCLETLSRSSIRPGTLIPALSREAHAVQGA